MASNVAYQIDWQTAASGKLVAATKRRVRFRFGFCNKNALAKGMSGTEARGEEHEVGFIWSLASGKCVVTYDGREVHHSVGRRGEAKFEATWPIPGNHILKIVAHATPPLSATPGFKQYDLILDGISYFELPRIYELGGRRGQVVRAVDPSPNDYGFAYSSRHKEEERHHATSVTRYEQAPNMSSYTSPHSTFGGSSLRATLEPVDARPASTKSVAPVDLLSQTAPPVSDANATDQFTPAQVNFPPSGPPNVANQILSAYGPPSVQGGANFNPQTQWAPPTPTQQQPHYATSHPYTHQQHSYPSQPAMVSPSAGAAGFYGQQQLSAGTQLVVVTQAPDTTRMAAPAVITPTMMQPLELDELRDSPPPVDEMDRAFQNLVNLNDLNETRVTPEQIKARKCKELQKAQAHNSRAKPPAATDWHVGPNASLQDIQKHKKPVAPPSKEVMKANVFDPAAAQAGMMVVYGQPQPQGGGFTGGIPASTGFGAGRVYHNGYNRPISVRSNF